MADKRPVELLAFNFHSRTFAYRRLAQGLSSTLSAFSSFGQERLDTVIKAEQYAQYVVGLGIVANSTEQLIKIIRAVFNSIRKVGLKLAIGNSLKTQVEYLVQKNYPPQSSTGRPQSHLFSAKSSFLKIKERSPKVHRLRKVLPELHTASVRKN